MTSDRLEGFERCFGLPVEDGEERSRRRVWLDTILFPVSDRADWDMKRPGEIGLGHAQLAPNSVDGDHEIELCKRRVGILAIFDGHTKVAATTEGEIRQQPPFGWLRGRK